MRARSVGLSLFLASVSAMAQVGDEAASPRVPTHDPTGGAYTPASPLFVPAAALPSLNVRARAGVELQPASGGFAVARPLVDLELGLPAGFTLAAGATWVGGTQVPRRETEGVAGLGAWGQVRWQFLGRGREHGLLGGAALTVKANGYRGGEPEIEASVSMQYRTRRFEAGLQGTWGRGLGDEDEHDLEARVYAAYRLVPNFALGVAGQLRAGIEGDETEALRAARCRASPGGADCLGELDLIAGLSAQYTWERWQLGVLLGASSIGLSQTEALRFGFYSQASGSVRF